MNPGRAVTWGHLPHPALPSGQVRLQYRPPPTKTRVSAGCRVPDHDPAGGRGGWGGPIDCGNLKDWQGRVRIEYWCIRRVLRFDGVSIITPHEFETLLPLAQAWAAEQERVILESGVALTDSQLADAWSVGVLQPERVRLLQVAQIPTPADPKLAAAVAAAGFVSPVTAGLALRYGIFIRDNCWGQRHVLVHLLVHVMQYERLGGFNGFLRAYLFECFVPPGYPNGPMEREAFVTSVRLCG